MHGQAYGDPSRLFASAPCSPDTRPSAIVGGSVVLLAHSRRGSRPREGGLGTPSHPARVPPRGRPSAEGASRQETTPLDRYPTPFAPPPPWWTPPSNKRYWRRPPPGLRASPHSPPRALVRHDQELDSHRDRHPQPTLGNNAARPRNPSQMGCGPGPPRHPHGGQIGVPWQFGVPSQTSPTVLGLPSSQGVPAG